MRVRGTSQFQTGPYAGVGRCRGNADAAGALIVRNKFNNIKEHPDDPTRNHQCN